RPDRCGWLTSSPGCGCHSGTQTTPGSTGVNPSNSAAIAARSRDVTRVPPRWYTCWSRLHLVLAPLVGTVRDGQVTAWGKRVAQRRQDLHRTVVVADEVQDGHQQHRHRLVQVEDRVQVRVLEDSLRPAQVLLERGGPGVPAEDAAAVRHRDRVG